MRFSITGLWLWGAMTLASATPALAQTDDHEAVKAVLVAVAEYEQAGDFSGLDTLFSQDERLHIIEGAGINHGWADYRDNHLKPEMEQMKDFQMRYYGVEPQIRGDVAWSSFRYELSAVVSSGKIEMEGRGTAVLERNDGRWVIVHLHTSGRRKRKS